jgi:hypothetical protein
MRVRKNRRRGDGKASRRDADEESKRRSERGRPGEEKKRKREKREHREMEKGSKRKGA